jgi:hypothetical protein
MGFQKNTAGFEGKMILSNNDMILNTFFSYGFVTLPPDNPGYTADWVAPAGF